MNTNDKRAEIKLVFYRRELLDDIRQYAFVEADIMPDEVGHAKHQLFDIAEKGNIERVTRVLSLAFSQCVEILYPYTKKAVEEKTVLDDAYKEDTEYIIHLSVPASYSQTTAKLLEEYIHEFLTCSIMADWTSINKPEAQANWLDKAQVAKGGIRSAKTRFIKHVRRGGSPF